MGNNHVILHQEDLLYVVAFMSAGNLLISYG